MKHDDQQATMFDFTMNVLLDYTNEKLDICPQFKFPIDSNDRVAQALRISLDLWESPAMTDMFVAEMKDWCDPRTYESVMGFRHSLRGPFYICEASGNKALLYSEGTVFEVHSTRRTWESLVPIMPDIIYTTLLPYEGVIVANQFVLHHTCNMEGPGVGRLEREYKEALERGVVTDSAHFMQVADVLNLRRAQGLMEPNSFMVMEDYIGQINDMTSDICSPYMLPECETPAVLKA